jgi:hypothetical protein
MVDKNCLFCAKRGMCCDVFHVTGEKARDCPQWVTKVRIGVYYAADIYNDGDHVAHVACLKPTHVLDLISGPLNLIIDLWEERIYEADGVCAKCGCLTQWQT